MEEDAPMSLPVELAPENGSLLLHGSITITRTTLSVFKMSDLRYEEPLFIGVCSVPLLRFVRRPSEVFRSSNSLLLISASEYLFIDAALSAGIEPGKGTGISSATTRSSSTGIYMRTPRDEQEVDKLQQLNNPASWRQVRLEFSKPSDFERCVVALLARNAEDATSEFNSVDPRRGLQSGSSHPEGMLREPLFRHESESVTSVASYGSRNRGTPLPSADQQSDVMRSCRSFSAGDEGTPRTPNLQRSSRPTPNLSVTSQRERESQHDVNTPRQVQQSRNIPVTDAGRPVDGQREVITLDNSLVNVATPRSSHHSRGLPERNTPTGSRRELESGSGIRTSHSTRRSRTTPIPPAANATTAGGSFSSRPQENERQTGTPYASREERSTPRSSKHGRGLPERSTPTSSRRELESGSGIHTPRGSMRGVERATPQDSRGVTKEVSENAGRQLPSGTFPASYNGRNVDVERDSYFNSQPPSYMAERSSAANSQRMGRGRTEHQFLLRNVMKFMHHRQHFIQYLHKELVHQAYLAEEARLYSHRRRGSRSVSVSRSFSQPVSAISPRSPRRVAPSGILEESARLREIEERLRAVEELHHEAELDRREAERARRDVEREKGELEHGRRLVERLRRELEEKLKAEAPRSGGFSTNLSPSRGASEMKESTSVRSVSARGHEVGGEGNRHNNDVRGRGIGSLNKYPVNDIFQSLNESKAQGSVVSHASRCSTPLTASGQVALASHPQQQQLQVHLPTPTPLTEVEYSTAIVNRYIYGDEWHLLYPANETQVRFYAVLDVSLTLKLPRRLVTITNISIDQPGLRLTVEVYYNRDTLPREVLERRFSTQPFYFLQRLYELRHCFNIKDNDTNPVKRGGRQYGSRIRHPSSYLSGIRDDSLSHESERDLNGYGLYTGQDLKARDILRGSIARGKQRERDVFYERERRKMALQRERLQQQLDKLEESESFRRSRLILAEAQERQNTLFDGDLHGHHTISMAKRALEEREHLERAKVEVGYARQSQVIAQAQRRNLAVIRIMEQEREHRARLLEQEHEARMMLNIVMNPLCLSAPKSQPEVAERMRRQRLIEAEAKQRAHIYANIHGFLVEALQEEREAVMSDEMTVRLVIIADEIKGRLDLACNSEGIPSQGRSGFRASATRVTPATWQALLEEEAMERHQLWGDEQRRRRLFQREYIIITEDLTRSEIELEELDNHILILDSVVQRNRAMLERRRQERNHLTKLINEEQYYRKDILSDEQDAWEMVMEIFDLELHDVLLTRNATLTPVMDLESPQRRRRTTIGTPRQTKPFHYMTFAPEDMEHAPTSGLAIEGILGCSINKNLEVTSIARPLPKVEAEELQFQAGDMILDVAGFSLHSLSHLREVLGNRAMQIQHEARLEFPEVPEEELTVNPALQKYVDVLCEHHNFLVQVLRGCDIYQIIVKS